MGADGLYWVIVAGGALGGAALLVLNLGAITGSTTEMLDQYAKVLSGSRQADSESSDHSDD